MEEELEAQKAGGCSGCCRRSFGCIGNTLKSMGWKDWLKLVVLLLLVVSLVLALVFLPWPQWLGLFLTWVDSLGVWGPILLAEMYVFCTVFFVPGSILTIGAGFAFQSVWIGTLAVSAGSTIGCICAFLFGNTLVRGWVERKVNQYEIFGALDTAIATKGWLIVLLLRLSPVIPFNILNYGLGLTKVSLIEYAIFSWLGMLPATVVYVYIGTTLSDIAQIISGDIETDPLTTTLFFVGLASTVLALLVISYFAKGQIQKVLQKAKEQNKLSADERSIQGEDYGAVV